MPEALASNHGVQCGFCSPGMVMSAYCCSSKKSECIEMTDIEDCLQGNLCRCTGYRPILEAFEKHGMKPESQVDDDKRGGGPGPKEVLSLHFVDDNAHHYFMPKSLIEVRAIQTRFKKTKFLQGNTGWYQQSMPCSSDDSMAAATESCTIHLGMVEEIKQIIIASKGVYLGAGVTLSHALSSLKNVPFCQPFVKALESLGSVQVRNQATVGGSIHWNHPSNDLKPLFRVYNCQVKYDQKDCYQPFETLSRTEEGLVTDIFIPNPGLNWRGIFCKKSSRKSFDLALLNMAALFCLENQVIKDIRIIFGGCISTDEEVQPASPNETMRYLKGRQISSESFNSSSAEEELLSSLMKDFNGNQTRSRIALYFITKLFEGRGKEKDKNKRKSSRQVFKEDQVDGTMVVHKSIPHIWGKDLALGKAGFVNDILPQPKELQLILIQSQAPYANFCIQNMSEVLQCPGVVGAVTAEDIPKQQNYWGLMFKDERVFASGIVEYHGQVIGGLLCDDQQLGQKALAKLKIEYQHLSPHVLNLKHAKEVLNIDLESLESFGGSISLVRKQDSELKSDDLELSGTLRIGGVEHFYMEPHTVLAIPGTEKEELVLHFSTQEVCKVQEQLAFVTGLPMHKIIVKNKRAGGAFGGKERMHVALIAAVAARKYQRPVRLGLSRKEDMEISGQRSESMIDYKVKVDKSSGVITAADFVAFCNAGISADLSIPWILMLMMRIDGGYTLRHFNGQGKAVRTNSPSNTAFRGFGGPEGAIYAETIMDRIASELNLPVLSVKYANLTREGDLLHYGQSRVRGCTLEQCWQECLEKSHYALKEEAIIAFNTKNKRVKRGLSIVPIKFTPSMMTKSAMKGSALVRVYADGTVLLCHGGIEMGQGLHTKMIQVAATALGISPQWIHVNETSTETLANTSPTGGSSGTDLNGPAVLDACHILNSRLEPFKKLDPSGSWMSWVQAAIEARVCLTVVGHYDKSPVDYNPVTGIGDPFAYFTYGCCAVQVEVNCYTGEVSVLTADIVMDIGKSLNPSIDVGQIEGAFMMGLGSVTTEQLKRDLATGKLLSSGPDHYKIPTVSDVPQELNVYLLEPNDAAAAGPTSAVYSSKGIGEPGILSSAATLLAIKQAIQSFREDRGIRQWFSLEPPCTAEKIIGWTHGLQADKLKFIDM